MVAFLVYLPVLLSPALLVGRSNDLQEFFWPIIYFVKTQITQNNTFPLWNNLFFSGTPLISDPQSSLFYLPNVIFLVLPIGAGFIISLVLHAFISGLGIYLTTRKALGLSQTASITSAILYMATPRLAGSVEAGHFGLAQSFAWPPFVLLGVLILVQKPALLGAIIYGFGLTGLFFTHTVTFIVILATSMLFFVFSLIFQINFKLWPKSLTMFGIAGILTFGLCAIALLPQLGWLPQTTRFMLLSDRDVYPKWSGKEEFIKMALLPWIDATEQIRNVDSEKWIPLGFVTVLLAFLGFWKLPSRFKVPVILLMLLLVIVLMNNSSPFYNFLLSQDWYVLIRVTTRVWPVVILTATILAGIGINKLWNNKNTKLLSIILSLVAITEITLLSWARLATPIPKNIVAPQEIYDFLKKDQEQFRVFCVTRCLSQKKAAEAGLELAEGYGTLQQKNYFNAAIQLYQIYWNRYTLSIPPTELYSFREIQPYAPALALFNIKYVIAPYELHDKRLFEEKRVGEYIIYKNTIAKPRAYFLNIPKDKAEILKYSPNNIKVRTQGVTNSQLILSEIFSPGWKAYLNGNEETIIKETPDALREVTIKPDTEFVDFRYEPKSYTIGKAITFATIIILAGILLNKQVCHRNDKWKTSYNLSGKKNSF